MEIEGGQKQTEFNDHHQNRVTLISFDPHATSIVVHCEGEVENADLHGVIGKHGGFAPLWYFRRSTELTRAGPNVRRLAKGLREEEAEDIPRLHALSSAHPRPRCPTRSGRPMPPPPPRRRSSMARGVCQDHSHIFVAAARAMGYPARYVSGYLMMNDRVHQDASHAWAEAHVEGVGWVGFDVSNGISPDARYVRVATGSTTARRPRSRACAFGRGARRFPSTSRCSSSSVAARRGKGRRR
jgi:hypothetical protein